MTDSLRFLILLAVAQGQNVIEKNFKLLPFSHSGIVNKTIFYENVNKATCAYFSSSRVDSYSFQYLSNSRQCGVHIGRYMSTMKPDPNPNLLIFWVYLASCRIDLGYTLYQPGNVCAKYFSNQHVFSEASSICEEDGGHLYIANTLEKLNLLKDILRTALSNDEYSSGIYNKLGGTDEYLEGNFTWFDGSPTIWGDYEADDFGTGEDCIGYVTSYSDIWDIKCEHAHSFMCEIPLMS